MAVIKRATLNDMDQVAEAFNQYRIWYGKGSDITGANLFLRERITKDESVLFIVLENDVLVGFAQLYPLFSSTRMKRLWLLNDLFVKKEHRGKGFSKELLGKAKELCHETGACGFMLETDKTNEIGNKLYTSAGMELNTKFNFYNWDVK